MTILTIPCPHCAHASRVSAEKLPDRPVAFACPRCKKKVVADKRKLSGSPQAAPPAPGPGAPGRAAGPMGGATASPPSPLAVPPSIQTDRRFLRLPHDAVFPSGIIVGEDEATIEEVQKALRPHRCELERIDSAAQARQTILNEQPDLCIFVGGAISGPPYPPMAPLLGLPPAVRRRLYLALIADAARTLDGNMAFLFQVNLTVARADLGHLPAALYSGIDYHSRLYQPYFQAEAGS